MNKWFNQKSKAAACGYFAVAAIVAKISSDSALKVFKVMEQLMEEYTIDDAAGIYYFLKGENPELEAYMKNTISSAKSKHKSGLDEQ